jgi:hypothetical protein
MKMAGAMQTLLVGEMMEKAQQRTEKVLTMSSSVSCEMQRQ